MEEVVKQILALLSQLQPEEAAAVIQKLAESLSGQAPSQGSSPDGGPNGVPVQ